MVLYFLELIAAKIGKTFLCQRNFFVKLHSTENLFPKTIMALSSHRVKWSFGVEGVGTFKYRLVGIEDLDFYFWGKARTSPLLIGREIWPVFCSNSCRP